MRLLAPLADRRVALLWGGLALSAIGDQLYALALSWIAVGVFGAAAGYLSALAAAAVLATALGAGAWADRRDHRTTMIAADLARAATLGLVVAVWLLQGAPPAWSLVLAVLVLAVGQAFFAPSLQTVLPALVRDARLLPAANGLLDATDRIARLLGPGLVGLLAGVLPLVHFLTVDAASFAASAAAVALIGKAAASPRRGGREGIIESILRGVRASRGNRLLGFVLVSTGPLNGLWYATFFLGLPLLIERLHVLGPGGSGLGAYGLVISAYGCTNFATTLVVGNRALPARPGRQMFTGNLVLAAGTALLAVPALIALPAGLVLPWLAASAAIGAIGGPMKDIPVAVLRQTQLARGDIAAGMRVYLVANNLGLLVAMLIAPSAFDALGVGAVTLICAGAIAAMGLAGIARLSGVVVAWDRAEARPVP